MYVNMYVCVSESAPPPTWARKVLILQGGRERAEDGIFAIPPILHSQIYIFFISTTYPFIYPVHSSITFVTSSHK
jgi:hypothetical protein